MRSFYEQAQISVEAIWPGMELGPVCLFRRGGPAFLFNHPHPPESFREIGENLFVGSQREWQLLGATQVPVEGVLTAIVDYGREDYGSPDEVFAVLFHELHHVYQRNSIRNVAHDNPAVLLRYPEDPRNDAIKLLEHRYLYQMCFPENDTDFRNSLDLFHRCREERKSIIGDYIEYEMTVENFEGPAFYCEYEFFKIHAKLPQAQKEDYSHRHFFGVLTTPYYGRNRLRMRHLGSGMAFCLILDRNSRDWKTEYYRSGMHLRDFFVKKLNPGVAILPDLTSYEAVSAYHTNRVIAARQKKYAEFGEQVGVEVVLEFAAMPDFRGFDPMHAEAIDEQTVVHPTLLRLGKGDNHLFFSGHPVVTYIVHEIWQVRKVRFFVSNAACVISGGGLAISIPGVDLEWTGEVVESNAKLLYFRAR